MLSSSENPARVGAPKPMDTSENLGLEIQGFKMHNRKGSEGKSNYHCGSDVGFAYTVSEGVIVAWGDIHSSFNPASMG